MKDFQLNKTIGKELLGIFLCAGLILGSNYEAYKRTPPMGTTAYFKYFDVLAKAPLLEMIGAITILLMILFVISLLFKHKLVFWSFWVFYFFSGPGYGGLFIILFLVWKSIQKIRQKLTDNQIPPNKNSKLGN